MRGPDFQFASRSVERRLSLAVLVLASRARLARSAFGACWSRSFSWALSVGLCWLLSAGQVSAQAAGDAAQPGPEDAGAASASEAATEDAVSACDAQAPAALVVQGQLRQARQMLKSCVDSECARDDRIACAGALKRLEDQMPVLAVRVQDGQGNDLTQVTVSVDGEVIATELTGLAIPVDPGEHEYKFERRGYLPVTRRLSFERGDRFEPVEIDLSRRVGPAPEAPVVKVSARKVIGWSLIGVGAVAGGGFAWFQQSANQRDDDLRGGGNGFVACAGTEFGCSEESGDTVPLRENLARASLGLGVASVGVGVLLLLIGGDEPSEGPQLAADLAPGGGSLTVSGRF